MDNDVIKRYDEPRQQSPEARKLRDAWRAWEGIDLKRMERLSTACGLKGPRGSVYLLFWRPLLGDEANTIIFPRVGNHRTHYLERDMDKLKRHFCERMGWGSVNILIEEYDEDAEYREWKERETAKTLQSIRAKCVNNRLFFGALTILIWQLCKTKEGKYKIRRSMDFLNWQQEDLPSCDISKGESFDPSKEECYRGFYGTIWHNGDTSELNMIGEFVRLHSFDSIEQAKKEIANGLFDNETVKALDILEGNEELEWKDVSFEKLWNYVKSEKKRNK